MSSPVRTHCQGANRTYRGQALRRDAPHRNMWTPPLRGTTKQHVCPSCQDRSPEIAAATHKATDTSCTKYPNDSLATRLMLGAPETRGPPPAARQHSVPAPLRPSAVWCRDSDRVGAKWRSGGVDFAGEGVCRDTSNLCQSPSPPRQIILEVAPGCPNNPCHILPPYAVRRSPANAMPKSQRHGT